MSELLEIDRLRAHPKNPRLDSGTETVKKLARVMKERGFDPAHALIVRPLASLPEGNFQIVSGHRRARAAKAAGLTEVPCWVRHEMSDEEAYALLLEDNFQDGLHPIEEGQHAIDSGLSQRFYAERHKINRNTLKPKIEAAEVYATIRKKVPLGGEEGIGKRWRALAALHAAPDWLWASWAPKLVSEQWKIEETAAIAGRVAKLEQPPSWADLAGVAAGLLDRTVRREDVTEMHRLVRAIADRQQREAIILALTAARPSTLDAAKLVIEAQTPLPSPAADAEDAPLVEDIWPESSRKSRRWRKNTIACPPRSPSGGRKSDFSSC